MAAGRGKPAAVESDGDGEEEAKTKVAKSDKHSDATIPADNVSHKPKAKGQREATKDMPPEADASSSTDTESDDIGDEKIARGTDHWRHPYFATSASFRQLDTVGGWHQYTLSGISIARAMGCSARMCSDYFRIGGQLFRIECYPAGFTTDTRRHMSIFLTTPGSTLANQVFCELSVLDQSGKERHITEGQDRRKGPSVCIHQGVVAAHPKFVPLKELDAHPKRYLRNDTLIIRATVEVVRSWSTQAAQHGSMAMQTGPYPGTPVQTGPPQIYSPHTAHAASHAPLLQQQIQQAYPFASQRCPPPGVSYAQHCQKVAFSSMPAAYADPVPTYRSHYVAPGCDARIPAEY